MPVMLMKPGKLHVLPFVGYVYRFQSGQDSFTCLSDNFRPSNMWKEGFYLSQYVESVGLRFEFKKRQKQLVAYALKKYIDVKNKKSYIEIRRIEPSNVVCDFFRVFLFIFC